MTAITFSDEARGIVEAARAQAAAMGHPYVGTEHLALAMVAAEEPALSQLFGRAGISYQDSLALTASLLGSPLPNAAAPSNTRADVLTERSQTVLDEATRECLHADRTTVTPTDLLMGLFREGGGVGVEVFRRLGLDAHKARSLVGESDAG